MAGGNLEEFNAKFHKGTYDPQEWCDHDGHWKIVKLSDTVYEGHCELCGLVTTEILHFEYWTERDKEDPYITIDQKKYRALKAWGNIAPCSECGQIFFETPLILWSSKDPSKAILFCPNCGERILEKANFKTLGYIPMRKQKEKP